MSVGTGVLRSLGVVASVVAIAGVVTYSGDAAAPPSPRTVAVIPSAGGPRLALVDARTLKPVRNGWSRRVPMNSFYAAFSPARAKVAIGVARSDGDDDVLILDARTGRVLRRYPHAFYPDPAGANALYWTGGEGTSPSSVPLLAAVGFDCASGGCGDEITILDSTLATEDWDQTGMPRALLRQAFVVAYCPGCLEVYLHDDEHEIAASQISKTAPFRVVADAVRDRIFVISGTGLVAEVDHVTGRPHVTYHDLAFGATTFDAAWAGAARIALWGPDGLGTIDTRTWTTQPITPAVAGVVATPYGLATWTASPEDGLIVCRPDGGVRYRALTGKSIRKAQAVGPYLYVDADARYSVDLRTGAVFGPISESAMLISPSLVKID